MTYFGQTLRREYTDLAIVLGADLRRTLIDYEILQRDRPEVLLGYRVILGTPNHMEKLRGYRPNKIVILDAVEDSQTWRAVMDSDAWSMLAFESWARIEYWYVGRIGVYLAGAYMRDGESVPRRVPA